MLVYVLNKNGNPLMPCSEAKARKLLDSGKAKVVRRIPFTIKLLYGSAGYKQQVQLKVDTGSKIIGVAATADNGKTLYASEVKTRSDIHKKMESRAMYRRNRRSRKTPYRPPRFNNRRRSDGWLTPTMRSKIQTHQKEITFVKTILPISKVIVETASFDIHKITNQSVSRFTYSKGPQKDFYNVKAFVLSRDQYSCQKCGTNNTNINNGKLHVHHIIFRSDGGTDAPDNLITLCEKCHDKIHQHSNPAQESMRLKKKQRKNTTDAVQVSTVSAYLKKSLDFDFTVAFGYETKFNRESLSLPKAHFVDAICIDKNLNSAFTMPSHVFKKVAIARGDYSQTESQPNKKGIRPKLSRGKVMGFKKLDRVEYFGTTAFVKGKMATGYAILMDIEGKKLDFGHIPQFKKMKRIGARKTCLTNHLRIESFTSSTISYSSANIEKIFLKRKSERV